MPDLNPRQLAFVEAHLDGANNTEAARKAGYKGSDLALAVTANRLLNNAKVKAFIDRRRAALAVRTDITRETLINDLQSIAASAIADKQYASAITAKQTIARMLGVLDNNTAGSHSRRLADLVQGIAVNVTVNAPESAVKAELEDVVDAVDA